MLFCRGEEAQSNWDNLGFFCLNIIFTFSPISVSIFVASILSFQKGVCLVMMFLDLKLSFDVNILAFFGMETVSAIFRKIERFFSQSSGYPGFKYSALRHKE